MRGLLEWHVASGTDGVVALGTTGEASTLDAAARDRVLETCVDACRGRVPVVAGTGAIDTRAVVAMGRRAKALGADGTLVVTPYYVKPPQRALEAHFLAVAEAVDLPMVLYNVPGRTGVDLLPETVARLAAHPNVAGIKEATGDNGRGAARTSRGWGSPGRTASRGAAAASRRWPARRRPPAPAACAPWRPARRSP